MPTFNRKEITWDHTWDNKEMDEIYSEQIDISDNYESQEEEIGSYESLSSQPFQDATRTMCSFLKVNEEIDRLHSNHYFFKYIWQKNFSAPIEHKLKENARVLDVGCGAGTWLLEMSTDFSKSTFIGVDTAAMYPSDVMPFNCEFMQCNVLDRHFTDNTFDFVHMQLMTFTFIDNEWFEKVINEMMRVLKSGGTIEIMAITIHKSNQGSITKVLYDSLFSYMHENGFMDEVITDRVKDHLMTNQFKSITLEEKLIPIRKRSGKFGITSEYLHNIWPSVRIPLSAHMGISSEKFDELVNKYLNEIDVFKTCLSTSRIYATKN